MDALQRAKMAALAASETKASDVLVLNVGSITLITDYLVICSGANTVQVQAIADNIRDRLAKAGVRPTGVEGYENGLWVLLDYGDVVVHVFREDERSYYGLERLWGDAEIVHMDALDEAPTSPVYTRRS